MRSSLSRRASHRASRRLRAAATVGLLGATLLGAGASPASAAPDHARHTRYYLALGDSLAAGYQTLPGGGSEVGHGYAQDLARTLQARAAAAHRGFSFTDLGCPGETTGSMLGGGCPYPHPFPGSQLDAAVAFLKAHHKDDLLVTLDIGANNVDGCAAGGSLDAACAVKGIATAGKDLSTILDRLRAAAGPHTRIVGMNLYDPFLAAWMTGPQGKVLAGLSVPLADSLNATLGLVDAAHGIPTADVAKAFSTNAFLPLVPVAGQQVPLNVARIMSWTNMSRGDIHANDTGYQVIADAFLAKI
ncbi:SGNH/GDSL hydrolase family protein [Streptomyces tateyamensis]|uniref:SGNH/GDSL hydrolase family protein n=1 Tax=Streptomyces tateyamensis TaxID=565073 RepID=A0A2V4NLY0_9ACTN|nr:SGNH/GDSL hydrolase family protein [Streptomyces tateyamensis]PYC76390.1 SGNH/GDSL hydrolase family protein [Streptomyces tateyamensis]